MTCRICGCTQYTACVIAGDFSELRCWWVDFDLCSFCAVYGYPLPGARQVELVTVEGGCL